MIFELVLEFHAWATSRPDYESAITGDTLFEEIQKVKDIEREQGTFRSLFGMRSTSSNTRTEPASVHIALFVI